MARFLLLCALIVGIGTSRAHAVGPEGSIPVAQADPDEAFDPFSDYSEFDEASDEEADINFFRNGRFFTFAVALGSRTFTGTMSSIYGQGSTYGLSITYFFDLRSALSLTYMTGDHAVNFNTNANKYTGNVSLSSMSFDYKHYFNTQNITRGLADLNPYALIGFGQFYRAYSLNSLSSPARDSTMGINIGAGLEIPLLRRKAYLGLQAAYHNSNFADENAEYIQNGVEKLEKPINGDDFDLLVILGMNF